MEENHTTSGVDISFFDKISFIILLGITFLAPLFFVPVAFISTQFGTSLLFAFGVITVIIIYIISSLASSSIDLPKPAKYVIGFTAIVPVVYILAGIANGFSRMSFFGYTFDISTVGFIVLAFAYLFLISILFREKNRIFYSYLAFVASSLIFSLFLLIRIIFGANVLVFGMFTNLTSTVVGSWNNVGIFFGIGAILSFLTYQMLSLSKIMKIILTVTLLLSLFFLALVNFGIVWIIVAVCSFLFILYSLFSSGTDFATTSWKKKLLQIPLYPFIVFVLSIIFVIWGTNLGGYLSKKFNVTNIEVRPSLSVTLDIAKNTLQSRPLFGSGPSSFVTQWSTFKPDDIVSTVFWNTDFTNGIGLIPTFAVTTGIIGVLSWLLFIGFFIYLGLKSIFVKISDSSLKYLITSSFFVSLYLWIMTFVYVPSTVIFILTFFFTGLFFASIYSARFTIVSPRAFSINPRTGFLSSLSMIVLFVASLLLGYGLFRNSQSLWYFQKSSYALNTIGDPDSSETYMKEAISAVPVDVYYRALSEIELVRLNRVVSQDAKKIKPEELQKRFSDVLSSAVKAGLAAKDADPTNYLNWISLGRVYDAVSVPELGIRGSYESASNAYGEALRRNPKNPGILVIFARLAATHKDLNLAKNYALQAVQTKPNYLDAYFLLSQIEVASGDIRGAIDATTASIVINPTDPGLLFQLGLLKYNMQDFAGAINALEKATTMTPDYANAKYFLGLSYEVTGQHDKAIKQFEDLKVTNPDSKEVDTILTNLKAGKPIFTNTETTKPEKAKKLPVKEKQ